MEFILPTLKILSWAGIGTIILGVAILLGIPFGRKSPFSYIFGSIFCIAVGIFIFSLRVPGKIVVSEDQLVLKATFSKTQVIKANEIKQAWVEDLKDSEWRPAKKRSGTAFGDVRTGWFTLKNGRKGYLVLQGDRALCIETNKEHVFLAGIDEFDEFLAQVKAQMQKLAEILE